MRKRCTFLFASFLLLVLFTGCCTMREPIQTESKVEIDRFMGDWYVVANIPTFIEKEAWNSLEQYEQSEPGVIDTTFTFNKGGPDGPLKTYTPTGFVRDDPSNAVWGMQFIWPFKAEYLILHVDEDYQETVIGRTKRDYLWIMARRPDYPEERIQAMIDLAVERGYDASGIRRVPHEGVEAGQEPLETAPEE